MGIALANVATAWLPVSGSIEASSLGGVIDGSVAEKTAAVLAAMFVHVRGLPMFSALLGYGLGMIVASLARRGYPLNRARSVIVRRYGLLAVFGVIHLVFLFFGDIMFFYGLAGMVMATMITFRDRTLYRIAGVMFGISIISNIFIGIATSSMSQSGDLTDLPADSYPGYVGIALIMLMAQVLTLPIQALFLLPLVILGFLAARHGVLSRVDEFRKQFWWAVGVAVAVIMVIGLPWGLAEIGVLPHSWATILSALNQALGPLTGPGIAAAIALAVQPLQRRLAGAGEAGAPEKPPLAVRMVAALGARSMSGYITQSILFLIFTQSFTLGWGIGDGILTSSAIAALVWAITVVLAFILELLGRRGPFETVHRYLSYGRSGLQNPYVDPRAQTGVATRSTDQDQTRP
ncbi:DUF418 domain-containing protein [Corynebacterium pacaense]|uniref:DUF418 domain-containing protein n=1 Tax=Corynebacterium pacaense TaxID=1816684 RepID=UPI001FE71744|nr:DUF418 domain-containing protein [Corynebacterium pacaense]